ncbi:MAG: S1C family serine protease [Candidatus Moraniibacteriota bacterium]
MKFIVSIKRFFRLFALFVLLTLVAGVVGAFVYAALVPALSSWSWTDRFSWPGSSMNGPTVIQKTEQVILSQEDGLERFVSAPRSAIVTLLSIPIDKKNLGSTVKEISGVLVTNDGLVVTYASETPLAEKRRYTVLFSDGNASQAEFVAYDATVNIAYFRTERADTPAIAFANSSDVRQGRRFMALAGTSDPDEGRLSSGYIGERSRTFNLSGKTVSSTDKWEGVFSPDRPLGAEFSGGAAVAMNGELIGLIGTLTFDASERSFIIPANAVRFSLQRVISGAEPARAYFGAYYVTLTKATSRVLGVSREQGAMIYTPSEKAGLAVIAGSPAEKSGLRFGDIVTAVDGREINPDWPLSVALYERLAGSEITLDVLRGGDSISLRANW